ncbi:uncharacterized protein LOC110453970 isoform X2 [Mizuhopecten yessoensis]|uniref:uncharacterized protein LOC110453970 isoform X2 n=1 Tax=Mizuhopecten yessoensis TaxID=6573 RepID=UPI000B459045|nr:uncharacterized protein LOC110453970 isoform X2 [Mizuhopecten yessoensis]
MASDNFRENLQPYCIAVEGFPADTNESQVRLVFTNCLKAESIAAGAQIQRTKWLMLFHDGAEVGALLKSGRIPLPNGVLEISPCVPCDIPTSWEKVDLQEKEEEEEKTEQLGMIKVTEISPKTTEDTLTDFFENRKRTGGGEIDEMDFRKESATAIITFKDPAEVERVLQKLPLLLEKKQIKVERFVPESYNSGAMGKDSSEEETSDKEKTKPSCTIEVRGVKETTSIDTIELYFESKKAAGKPLEIVKLDHSEREEGVIYITYETEDVVRAVVEREHKLEGVKLEVKQYIPPPPPKPRPLYPDKVLIKGKNPDTTQDGLENFLEAKANVTPTNYLLGEEEDTVLVTFEEPPDFEKLELACKKKALDKHFLKVSRVPISNCILVKGAGDKTSLSTLEFYFENTRRSGGGDVTEVKDQEDGSYLVYFEDHTVIDGVCGRSHTVDSGEDGPKFKVPDVLVITDLDPRKIQFVQYSQPNKDGIEKQLTAQHTKIIWPEKLADPVKLVCLLTKDVKDCRNLAKAWTQTARKSLDMFLDVLLVFKHQILQDAWDGVIAQLQDMDIFHPDGVTAAVEKVSFEIFVMGHKKFATEVSQSLEKIIGKIADELHRKKKQVKETTSPMKHHQVVMLSLTHFTDTMEKKYPGMKVTLDFKARTVTYEGMYGEVTSAKLEMYEKVNAMVASDVGDFNKGRYAYLQDKAVKQYVARKMKEDKIMSVWEMQDNRFVVYAMTDDAAVRAAHILRDSVLETIVDVKKESSSLLSSYRWAIEERSIKDSCNVMVQMKVQMNKPCIVIYSTDRDAGMVKKRLTDFLR